MSALSKAILKWDMRQPHDFNGREKIFISKHYLYKYYYRTTGQGEVEIRYYRKKR